MSISVTKLCRIASDYVGEEVRVMFADLPAPDALGRAYVHQGIRYIQLTPALRTERTDKLGEVFFHETAHHVYGHAPQWRPERSEATPVEPTRATRPALWLQRQLQEKYEQQEAAAQLWAERELERFEAKHGDFLDHVQSITWDDVCHSIVKLTTTKVRQLT